MKTLVYVGPKDSNGMRRRIQAYTDRSRPSCLPTLRTGRAHVRPSIPSILELIEQRRLRPELIASSTIPWRDLPYVLVAGGFTKLVGDLLIANYG